LLQIAPYEPHVQLQPSSQLSQQSPSQPQSGQPAQHFAAQQPWVADVGADIVPAIAAAASVEASAKPPNNFVNIANSLSG
jgi:hypothetical protein